MKYFSFLTLLLLLAGTILAQQAREHAPKMYHDADGKLYVNKNAGFYMFIGMEPEASANKSVKLEDAKKRPYTNPFYFDTEGLNTIRSPWAVNPGNKEYVRPKQDVVFHLWADSRPPRTQVQARGEKLRAGQTHYLAGQPEVVLKAKDELAGTETTFVSINGEAYQEYEGPIALEAETQTKIKFYSVDHVGNAEKPQELILHTDTQPPQSNITIDGRHKDYILPASSALHIEATDALSGIDHIYYSLSGGDFSVYNNKLEAQGLEEGKHTIEYYAKDNAGNTSETQTLHFAVDKTPPRIVQDILGDQYYARGKAFSSGRSRVQIVAADNRAGVQTIYYRINKGKYHKYTEPFNLPITSGEVIIESYAVDHVGNSSETTQQSNASQHLTYQDLTAPEIDPLFYGPQLSQADTLFISPHTFLQLRSSDTEAGLQKTTYSINGGEPRRYNEPLKFDSGGYHSLTIRSYDNVNNTAKRTLHFKVDTSGPEIIHHFNIQAIGQTLKNDLKTKDYPLFSVIYLAATDQSVGVKSIRYHINENRSRQFSNIVRSFDTPGLYNIKVEAEDALGNVNNQTISFYIKE